MLGLISDKLEILSYMPISSWQGKKEYFFSGGSDVYLAKLSYNLIRLTTKINYKLLIWDEWSPTEIISQHIISQTRICRKKSFFLIFCAFFTFYNGSEMFNNATLFWKCTTHLHIMVFLLHKFSLVFFELANFILLELKSYF